MLTSKLVTSFLSASIPTFRNRRTNGEKSTTVRRMNVKKERALRSTGLRQRKAREPIKAE